MTLPYPHVSPIAPPAAAALRQYLAERGFRFRAVPHASYSAAAPGLTCTVFKSGKLLIQGRNSSDFLHSLPPSLRAAIPPTKAPNAVPSASDAAMPCPHIGQDEAGKGDLFGPLCVGSVYVSAENAGLMAELNIRDTKLMKDRDVRRAAIALRERCIWRVLAIAPPEYNEKYERVQNLNKLLAWAHAELAGQVARAADCPTVLIDQFASPRVVLDALAAKGQSQLDVHQRMRAESDVAVCCAAILARCAFLDWLQATGDALGIELPKGCGERAEATAREIKENMGSELLRRVAKWHFRTIRNLGP